MRNNKALSWVSASGPGPIYRDIGARRTDGIDDIPKPLPFQSIALPHKTSVISFTSTN